MMLKKKKKVIIEIGHLLLFAINLLFSIAGVGYLMLEGKKKKK